MVTLTALSAFDQLRIDFHVIERGVVAAHLSEDLGLTYLGATYADVMFVDWMADGTLYGAAFAGTGLTLDRATGLLVDGEIEAYLEFVSGAGRPESTWTLTGAAIDAPALFAAILSPGVRDDRAILKSALAGADRFDLSDGDDRASGLGGNDWMMGWGGDDVLAGGAGRDTLLGGQGDDDLRGGAGADWLQGGAGRDRMDAGRDAARDVFVFDAAEDSGTGRGADTVLNFDARHDLLDLSRLDAHPGRPGDRAFAYADGPAAHAAWFEEGARGTRLALDLDGDARADFEVLLVGATGLSEGNLSL